MKKTIIIVLILSCLFIGSPVFAACSEESGDAVLYSNSILNGIKIRSYKALGASTTQDYNYGVSTFAVTMNSRNGASYYGYSLDPGLGWDASTPDVCCDALRDSRYTRGIKAGFVDLAKKAGAARKDGTNADYITITDMALRFYAMANGLSNVRPRGSGAGFYQLSKYLQTLYGFYRQGQINFGRDHEAINIYVNNKMNESIYAGYDLHSFIIASTDSDQAYIDSIVTQAYNLYLKAMDKKASSESMGFGSYHLTQDIAVDVDDSSITCDGRQMSIPLEMDSSITETRFLINNNDNVSTSYINGMLSIDTTRMFDDALCENGSILVNIQVQYKGGRDENLYYCSSTYGGNKPNIISYVGKEGTIANSTTWKTYSTTVTIPGRCVPSSWTNRCFTGEGARCETPDKKADNIIEVKSSLNNCCYADGSENTSTVTDALSSKSVDDDLDINDLFLFNPDLSDPHKLSVVKCGVRTATAAPDFISSSGNTDIMKKYCQMYCMERTQIITPPPVTVTAGRYFELDFTKFDIKGERQCRISLDNSAIFERYTELANLQKTTFNNYYENAARSSMYTDAYDRSFVTIIEPLSINCTKAQRRTWCNNSSAEGADMYSVSSLKCSTPITVCQMIYDKVSTSSVWTGNYPIFEATVINDTKNKKTGKYAYGAANTQIRSIVQYKGKKASWAQDPPSAGFFTLDYKPSGCLSGKSAFELAGSPNCKCPNGGDVLQRVAEKYKCCADGGRDVSESECPAGKWGYYCTKYHTNTYYTAANNFFTCDFSDDAKDRMDLITNRSLYRDYKSDRDNYTSNANTARGQFAGYTEDLLKFEAAILDCLHFFDGNHYGAIDMDNHYDVSKIKTSFEYDQIFSTTSGGMTTQTISGRIDPNCTVTLEDVEGDFDPRALGDQNYINFLGFHSPHLSYKSSTFTNWEGGGSYSQFLQRYASSLNAEGPELFYKYITIDGTYRIHCTFDNKYNDYYTLVPGGNINVNSSVNNYVSHEKLFPTYLTTYAGKHEILYHVSGLGSQIARRFDPYFQRGTTCSGRSSGAYNAPASCYIDVKQKLVTTGVCENVASTSNFDDNCYVSCAGDGSCNSIYNFVFKNVEPENIFPIEPPSLDTASGWGKNWLTSGGKATRDQIESDGKKDLTYSPSSLTYSFVLTSKTITAIKDYNSEKYDSGGYNDFDFSCNCGTNGSKACIKCVSTFLSNLAQRNTIETINTSYVSQSPVWGNEQTIQEVRNNNHNWDKDNTPAKAELS